jgi:hypothetical protein
VGFLSSGSEGLMSGIETSSVTDGSSILDGIKPENSLEKSVKKLVENGVENSVSSIINTSDTGHRYKQL